MVHIQEVGPERKGIPLSGSRTFSPAMSSSPTSPTSHVLSITFGPLGCVKGVFISFIGFEPWTSTRFGWFLHDLFGHNGLKISYLLYISFVRWLRTSF